MSNLMLSDLIRTTRQLVQGNARSPINELASQKLSASTTAVLTYPVTGISIGSTVEIGWVLYQVVDLNASAKTLTVLPEIPGSALTDAAGTRVTVRPRYPVRRIIEELNADLMDLSGQGIYKLRRVADVDGVVTVPADALIVLGAYDGDLVRSRNPHASWDHPTTATELEWTGHLVFGCTLSDFPYDADVDVDTTGLVSTAEDLPSLGAAMRLLAGTEAQRNLIDTQGETRRASEVLPGAITTALRNLAAIRAQRIITEAKRFQQRYGVKLHEAV